jgi:hypothetical protein
MADLIPREKVFISAGEEKTFCFDYTKHGGVRGGDTLSNPVFAFVDDGSGVTDSGTAVTDADFFDFEGGKTVKEGKGAIVVLDATGTPAPGTYTMSMTVTIGTDPAVKLLADLVVTDEGGEIP